MDDAMKLRGSAATARSLSGRLRSDDLSDAALVEVARKDPARFVALYDRYLARVYAYVRLRARDRSAAEDITSEVFLAALTKLSELRNGQSFRPWLFRIAANAVNAAARRASTCALDEAALELADEDPSPEEQLLASEQDEKLRAVLASFSPRAQDLVLLRYTVGLSYAQIGEALGMSSVAARVAVHRIQADLRRRLST
jgi:RNA polymerase sigma-70 factor, ECF subfamily